MILLEDDKILLKYEQKLKINRNKNKDKVYEYKEVAIPEDIYTYWWSIIKDDELSNDLRKVYLYQLGGEYIVSPVKPREYNVVLNVRGHGNSRTNSSKQIPFNREVQVTNDIIVFSIDPYHERIVSGGCFISGIKFA